MGNQVPEFPQLKDLPEVTCAPAEQRPEEVWGFVRLNERMRFMRYGHGDQFKRSSPFLFSISSFWS